MLDTNFGALLEACAWVARERRGWGFLIHSMSIIRGQRAAARQIAVGRISGLAWFTLESAADFFYLPAYRRPSPRSPG